MMAGKKKKAANKASPPATDIGEIAVSG